MKRIFTMFALMASIAVFAQNIEKSVPVSVFIPEWEESIPAASKSIMESRLNNITSQAGMGAVNFTQFYLSCTANVIDRNVVGGAPTKYLNEVEMNLFVIDALGKRIFDSYNFTLKGVGNSDQKAYNAALKSFRLQTADVKKFMMGVNDKIIRYYENQVDVIIAEATTLGKARKYDEAFFRLSLVPDVCDCYAKKILPTAEKIWQEYLDFTAHEALMKARAAWSSGMDRFAAIEAVQYLAEIPADSKYYSEAMSLLEEIKGRVKEDIDYARALEKRDADREYDLSKSSIDAWKSVGVAYGNNQQPVTYRESYIH